jgi:hypothetical protein
VERGVGVGVKEEEAMMNNFDRRVVHGMTQTQVADFKAR